MKLEAWLSAACLASVATAMGPPAPGKPVRPKGKPERLADWKWKNPFAAESNLAQFETPCTAEKTFQAKEYLLDDISEEPPLGLSPYMDALKKVFENRQYPGSWDGIDPHGYDRNLLQMEYADVPVKVREWIEAQERDPESKMKGLFVVYQKPPAGAKAADTVPVSEMPIPPELRELDEKKTVLFAPGALYEVLPLWVGEESDCADTLLDLAKYSPDLADGAVVAYPVDKTRAKRAHNKRDIEFTVKAQVLKAKPDAEKKEAPKTEESTKLEEGKTAKDEL